MKLQMLLGTVLLGAASTLLAAAAWALQDSTAPSETGLPWLDISLRLATPAGVLLAVGAAIRAVWRWAISPQGLPDLVRSVNVSIRDGLREIRDELAQQRLEVSAAHKDMFEEVRSLRAGMGRERSEFACSLPAVAPTAGPGAAESHPRGV